MPGSMFKVFNKPFCVWDDNLEKTNKGFLDSFDPSFFDYLARTHLSGIETEDKKLAATALRLAYLHGLETFFTLIGATLQAPKAPLAWILKCQPESLRKLIQAITDEKQIPYIRLNLTTVTWKSISERINRYKVPPSAPEPVEFFAKLWKHLAWDFLQETIRLEHNSLKHGLRVQHGDSMIEFKKKDGEKQVYGGVDHGSKFRYADQVPKAPKCNFTLRHGAVNWTPDRLANSLQCISVSINNVISFLKMLNGFPASEAQFRYPLKDGDQEFLEDEGVSLSNITFGMNVSAENIHPFTVEDINKRLDQIEAKRDAYSPEKTNDQK